MYYLYIIQINMYQVGDTLLPDLLHVLRIFGLLHQTQELLIKQSQKECNYFKILEFSSEETST